MAAKTKEENQERAEPKEEKSVEVQTIEKKLQKIRNDHTLKTKNRNALVKDVQKIDEELVKLIGAHQTLNEVLKELTDSKDESKSAIKTSPEPSPKEEK